jgi:hypothetical protein
LGFLLFSYSHGPPASTSIECYLILHATNNFTSENSTQEISLEFHPNSSEISGVPVKVLVALRPVACQRLLQVAHHCDIRVRTGKKIQKNSKKVLKKF